MSALECWAKEIAIIRKATDTLDEIYDNIMPENLVAMIEELVDELGSLQDDAALGALVRQMPLHSPARRSMPNDKLPKLMPYSIDIALNLARLIMADCDEELASFHSDETDSEMETINIVRAKAEKIVNALTEDTGGG